MAQYENVDVAKIKSINAIDVDILLLREDSNDTNNMGKIRLYHAILK